MHLHFCKKYGLFFFFLSLTSLFHLPKGCCLLHCSTQLYSQEQMWFLLQTDFFNLSPFFMHLSFPFPPHTNPHFIWKRSSKAVLFVPQPQTKPNGQKEDKKVNEASRNITHVPYVQQPTEDAKNSFQYTSPATLLGLPLWKENFPIFFSAAHLSIDSYLNTEKSAHRSANWIYILTE